MRKSLLSLAFLAAGAACINAQNVKISASKSAESAKAMQKMNIEKRELATPLTSMKKTAGSFLDNKGRIVRRAEGEITASYGFPIGGLFYGMSDDGYSFNAIRMLTDAFTDVTFTNYSNDGTKMISDVTWSWPSGAPLTDTQTVNEDGDLTAQVFGSIKFPVLKAGNSTYGETFNNKSAFWESGTEDFGVAEFAMSQTETESKPISISNACIQLGAYSGFTNGGSFTSNENFLTLENGAWKDTGKKLVGFGELFDKPLGFVYAKDVSVAFWTEGITDASKPLEGKTLSATIYTFGADGKLKPYATATATDENTQALGTEGLYLISFEFMEEDPILGSVEAPIALPEEDFFVTITGFEQLTGKFIGRFASANGGDGHGYAILEDGSLSTIPYRDSPSVPQCNLHIGFHAAVPVAEIASPENGVAVVPEAGGYAVTATQDGKNFNDVDIYTLSSSDKWIVDKPEWIEEVELSDDYISRGLLIAYINGKALPAGVDGRSGKVVFTLFGKSVEVTVNQGNVSTAISSVENNNINKNGAIYNIAGQKVNKDYKGVVIQDGKKFIQK